MMRTFSEHHHIYNDRTKRCVPELGSIINAKLIHSVIKTIFVASKQGVSVQKISIFWIKVEVEDKAREDKDKEAVVDPDVSPVKVVDCLLVGCLSIEKCQCGGQK